MSLVYDENSDEIRCVLRVNIHEIYMRPKCVFPDT
jgi:hypothetical protein